MQVGWAIDKWVTAYGLVDLDALQRGALERIVHEAYQQRGVQKGVSNKDALLTIAREVTAVFGACRRHKPCLLDLMAGIPPVQGATSIGVKEAFLHYGEARWWYLQGMGVEVAEIDPRYAKDDFQAFCWELGEEWLGHPSYELNDIDYPVNLFEPPRKLRHASSGVTPVFEPHQLMFQFDPRIRSLAGFVSGVSCGSVRRRSRSQPFDKLAGKVLSYEILPSRLQPHDHLEASLPGTDLTLGEVLPGSVLRDNRVDLAGFLEHARAAVRSIAGDKEWSVWLASMKVPRRGSRRDYRAIGREAGIIDCPRSVKKLLESAEAIVNRLAEQELNVADDSLISIWFSRPSHWRTDGGVDK